jgi:hypothetical protein
MWRTCIFGEFGRARRWNSLDWKAITSEMSCAFPTIAKGLSLDLNFELRIIIRMIDTSSWWYGHLSLGNCLAIHKGIIGIGGTVILLSWGAPLHLQFPIIHQIAVLFVLKISCAYGGTVHLFLGEVNFGNFIRKLVVAWWSHFYSIHNWNIYYFNYEIMLIIKMCPCLKNLSHLANVVEMIWVKGTYWLLINVGFE